MKITDIIDKDTLNLISILGKLSDQELEQLLNKLKEKNETTRIKMSGL